MLHKVKAAIEQYDMLGNKKSGEAGKAVLTVAISGGADSVALLHALRELGYDVSAVHVNHNLRGDESNRDEAFVRDLCAKLDVDLTVHSIKITQGKHQSLEEAAREARYALFAEATGRPGVRPLQVATGHTATDNTETVLLNLIRGTGLKGLCGIPPKRDNIIRPLILCERNEIEEYCRANNLQYVTDSTNNSDEFTRNKLRLSLIPLIREINPSFDGCVTRMCEILREDSDFLERQAATQQVAFTCDFSINHLKTLEKPILTRIIMGLLTNNNISPSNLRVSQVIEIIEARRGKINLSKHKFALIEDEILKIKTIPQNYR